jgi:hypothetical protein
MKNNLVSKLVAAACALSIVAVPATALAQPATTTANDPIVAQSAYYDYSDAILIALTDAGYAPYEANITDLDTYVNVDGFLVDHVGFNVGGMHFDYIIDYFDGTIYDAYVCVL